MSSNHQYKVDTVEWFHRSQPTGGGRQLGFSRPVRTETVNTAMAPALLSGTNRGRGCVVRGLTSLYPPVSLIEQKSFLLSLSGVMCVRISGIQLPFPFSRACNLPVPVICSGCQPVSHTFFSQNDFFYDQPVRAQTVCRYRTDLDPFSPPFCLNVITLHLGECHYKLWGYNSVVSNECSIKQRAPTRQTGPNKAN